jgi:hypothetical protein
MQAVRLLEGLPPASSHQAEALKLDEAISWDEYLEFASKSAVAFAKIVTPHEAEILGLSDVASYLLGQAESYTVVAQVRGAEPGVRRVDMERVPYQDPYLRFKLTSAWQLRRGEELGKITWHDGSPLRKTHAMMDLALAAAKEARAYNRRQHRVPIEFDPDQIGASLDQTLFHRAEDALTIATSVGRTACERRIVESRTAAVLYCNPSTMRREGVGVNWLVTSSIYTSTKGPGLDLIVLDEPSVDSNHARRELMSIIKPEALVSPQESEARSWIFAVHGFSEDDAYLTPPAGSNIADWIVSSPASLQELRRHRRSQAHRP